MLFDNVTLKKGMDFAAQLCAVHRQLSPIDLRDILLGCFSGLPIAGKTSAIIFVRTLFRRLLMVRRPC